MFERSEFCIFSKIYYILAWTRQGLIFFGYFLLSRKESNRGFKRNTIIHIIKEKTSESNYFSKLQAIKKQEDKCKKQRI